MILSPYLIHYLTFDQITPHLFCHFIFLISKMLCKRPRSETPQRITRSSAKRVRLLECSTSVENFENQTSKTPHHDQQTLMTSKLELLPDLPLIAILEKVPLVDILPLRAVSR